MSIYKNIDSELGLDIMTRARQQLRVGPLELSEEQPYLKIATQNGVHRQAVWEKIREIEKGKPVSYDRFAILSFAHTHNLHERTGAVAHFSSTSMMFESQYTGMDPIKGSLTLSTSETEDGQSGLSRFSLQDGHYREVPYTEETSAAFHQQAEAIMGRLIIVRNVAVAHQEIA